jgi:lipoprotein NlpI
MSRGATKGAKEDLDGALADFDRAIELDPKQSILYIARGGVKATKGDSNGAIADCNRAIELDPKQSSAYSIRGYANLVLRKWKAALDDHNKSFELSDPNQEYPRIFVWLIRARLGETNTANADLAAYLDKRPNATHGDWISKIAGYLLDKVPEADFFTAAKSANERKDIQQLCQAWFYVGMKKLLAGDRIAAGKCFGKSVSTGEKSLFEYPLAESELKALTQ